MNAFKVKTKKRVTFLLPSEADEDCIPTKPIKELPALEESSISNAYQLSNSSMESIDKTESLSPGHSVSPVLSLSSEEPVQLSSGPPLMLKIRAAALNGHSMYDQENLSTKDSIQDTLLFSKSEIPSPQVSSATPRYSTSAAGLASTMRVDSSYQCQSMPSNASNLHTQVCDTLSQCSDSSRCKQFEILFENNSAPHIQLLERVYNHFLDSTPSNRDDYTFSSMRFLIISTLSLNKSLKEFASSSFTDVKAKLTATRALQDSDDQLRRLTEYLLGITSPSVISKSVSPHSTNSSISSSRSTSYRHVADIFPSAPSNKADSSSPYGSCSLGSSSPSSCCGSFQGLSSGAGISTKSSSKYVHRYQPSSYRSSYHNSSLINQVSSEHQELAPNPMSKKTSYEQIICHQTSTPSHNYCSSPSMVDIKPEYHHLVGGQQSNSGNFSKAYSLKCSVQSDVLNPSRQPSYHQSSLSSIPTHSRTSKQHKLKQPYH